MTKATRIYEPISLNLLDPPPLDGGKYNLIWNGGDLGFTLGKNPTHVVRTTGKGSPHGIEHVRPGDILLSVNGIITKDLPFEIVVKLLRECPLPAILHLSSPDFAKQYRKSNAHSDWFERPVRLSFTPPAMTITSEITSPRNSSGPSRSLLVVNPASSFQSPVHGPRRSAPF